MKQPLTPNQDESAPHRALRVVAGLHRGAQTLLKGPALVVLGSADDADFVLSDAGVAPRHLAITMHEDGTAVRALDGEVRLGQRVLARGEVVPLEQGLTLGVGGATIYVGAADDEQARIRLVDGEERSRAQSETSADAAPVTSTGSAEPNRRGDRLGVGRNRIVVAAVASVVVACIFALALTVGAYSTGAATEQELSKALSEARLDEVRVVSLPRGGLALEGVIQDDETRAALLQRLSRHGLTPALRLSTGAQLAEAVKDVFRMNGMNIEALYTKNGVIVVHGLRESGARVDQMIQMARRDIPGVSNILRADEEVVEASEPIAAPIAPIDANAKRVVSIVDGSPSYILTADGSRYFVGALMPHGYRVANIAGETVTLERDGKTLVMTF